MSIERPPHPGTITYEDGAAKQVLPVAEVPEEAQFVKTRKGWVPIVWVTAHTEGDVRCISEYGPDKRLLRTTRQRR